MKLNLGSGYSGNDALFVLTGRRQHPDWICVDVAEHYRDAAKGCARFDCYDFSEGIREQDASIELVWLGDTLEHVYKHRCDFVLSECFRVLQPGGRILISVPDAAAAMAAFLESDGEDQGALDLIHGQQDARDGKNCGPDSHYNSFTEGSLRRKLQAAGFVDVERTGVHRVSWELAMTGRKP